MPNIDLELSKLRLDTMKNASNDDLNIINTFKLIDGLKNKVETDYILHIMSSGNFQVDIVVDVVDLLSMTMEIDARIIYQINKLKIFT